MDDMPVLVVGGGAVATRRVSALLEYGARVTIVAPTVTGELCGLASREKVVWRHAGYDQCDLDGMRLAIAATNDRSVNHRVGLDAKACGIPVSVADRREECTFYFPALASGGGLTVGLVSPSGNHKQVAKAAAIIRNELEMLDAKDTSDTGRCEGQ